MSGVERPHCFVTQDYPTRKLTIEVNGWELGPHVVRLVGAWVDEAPAGEWTVHLRVRVKAPSGETARTVTYGPKVNPDLARLKVLIEEHVTA